MGSEDESMAILRLRDADGNVYEILAIKGDPGETPVLGVDYWTPEDKQEILDEAVREITGIADIAMSKTLTPVHIVIATVATGNTSPTTDDSAVYMVPPTWDYTSHQLTFEGAIEITSDYPSICYSKINGNTFNRSTLQSDGTWTIETLQAVYVDPAEKTSDMIKSVGIDSNGKLWTKSPITLSTSAPTDSEGEDGDIWMVYSE